MNQTKIDNEALLGTLKELIDRTYVLENEYKDLSSSYKELQTFLKEILEVTPNALWVFELDETIFLENSEAKEKKYLIEHFDFEKEKYQLEVADEFFLIKINKVYDKLIVNATDVTNERKINQLASMGQIAAHLAHEIRNPIGSVSILASTLMKKVKEENRPIVNEMQKAVSRVERIIKSTLLFSKDLVLEKSFFTIEDMVRELEESIKTYSFSKNIEFKLTNKKDVINADFNLLLVVFQNFIFNAIDAIEECEDDRGVVSFLLEKRDNKNIFIIEDSGKDVEDKSILYEPFKTSKTKGHGLGLALSLQIIKAHNGDVEFKSNPKRFEIIF